VRTKLKKCIDRGKVDVFISYEDLSEGTVNLKYNSDVAREYMKNFQIMSEEFGLEYKVTPVELGRFPDVFTVDEQDINQDEIWAVLSETLDEATEKFNESRAIEGENLKNDMLDKLDSMTDAVDYIEKIYPSLMEEYRRKLTDKISEVLDGTATNVDENRIATEVVIYADKICVDEETVRLKSHIQSTKKILEDGGNVGRKLDFIAQEMNREANTILSKANSLEVSDKAIQLKTDIEKVREQIQNLE
jgi:uncharacterized protein (TIGR00255 family)